MIVRKRLWLIFALLGGMMGCSSKSLPTSDMSVDTSMDADFVSDMADSGTPHNNDNLDSGSPDISDWGEADLGDMALVEDLAPDMFEPSPLGNFRYEGGFSTLGPRAHGPSGDLRLLREGFEWNQKLCNNTLCVTGGIR